MVFVNLGPIANSTILWYLICMVSLHLLSKYQPVTGALRERRHKSHHKERHLPKNSSLIFLTIRGKKRKKNSKRKKMRKKR
jgi:hypothetical protein